MLLRNSPRRLYIVMESIRSAALGTIMPVFALYYRHFDITLFQIALLAALFEATILIWEIPTGIWADRVSRRAAVVVSELCLTVGGLVFIGFPGFWFFIVGEIFQGVGEAFGSGSLEAWIVDELQIGDQRQATESLFASTLRWKTVALLTGSVAGGIVGAAHVRWIWVPFAALHLCGLLLSLSMREAHFGRHLQVEEKGRTRKIIASGAKRLKQSVVLRVLVGFGLISAFAEEGIDEFWQVYMHESLHFPVGWFGILVALPSLLVFLFAPRIIDMVGRRLRPGFSISLFQIVLVAGIFGFALLERLSAVFCLGAVFMLVDLKKPIVAAWANRQIATEHRASILSFLNMVSSAGEAGAGLVFGSLAVLLGLRDVFILAACVSFVAVFMLMAGRDAA